MTDALSFDIAEMFSGVSYPTKEVDAYMDAGLAASIAQLNEQIKTAVIEKRDDELPGLEEKAKELYKKAQSTRYVFHLRGVRRELQVALLKEIEEKFPVETDFLGRPKPNLERDEYEHNATWALYIEKIVSPSGGIRPAPTVEEIALIRNQAPIPTQRKIQEGIKALSDEVANGIEAIAAEHDFLSQR